MIHRAVTRGLDATNTHLKASGVEWLGEMPANWEVRRNGQLFQERTQTGVGDLPILEVSIRTGIRVREFAPSRRKQIMTNRAQYKRALKGDIAYNTMRMWQGAVGVIPMDGLVSPAYVVATPRPGAEPRYFVNLFRTTMYMHAIDEASRGIVKDRNRLYWESFKQLPSLVPGLSEQMEIANAVEDSTRSIRDVQGRAQREIALVREYRTRLIADLVTGKLDVREAAARLPDERDRDQCGDECAPDADPGEADVESELDAALAGADT